MNHPPRRIALTGGIASGKSLVGEALRERGIPVIDADDVVHRLLREDEGLKARIRQEFGPEVFTPEGAVDRPKLGQKVFGDVDRRKLLESWIHPETRAVIERFYQEHWDARAVVSIIPLLFESALEDRYDEVWLLLSDEATQLRRLQENRGMSREDALARIQNQMPAEEKVRRARLHRWHVIWENNGQPADLLRQLDARLAAL